MLARSKAEVDLCQLEIEQQGHTAVRLRADVTDYEQVHAAVERFRPIMMTTLAALFGAVPLAFESGTGSELRNPLGVTIIGGLLLSQLLTLYTTPVIYLALERLKQRFNRPRPFVPSGPRAAAERSR